MLKREQFAKLVSIVSEKLSQEWFSFTHTMDTSHVIIYGSGTPETAINDNNTIFTRNTYINTCKCNYISLKDLKIKNFWGCYTKKGNYVNVWHYNLNLKIP